MAGYPDPADRLSFPDILDPVLDAPADDDDALDEAINTVAEALADSGTLIVDALGRAAYGVTDEEAVLGLLDTYIRVLLHLGEVEEAAELGDVIERIHRFQTRRKRRGSQKA